MPEESTSTMLAKAVAAVAAVHEVNAIIEESSLIQARRNSWNGRCFMRRRVHHSFAGSFVGRAMRAVAFVFTRAAVLLATVADSCPPLCIAA
jgi:hypothetical protein